MPESNKPGAERAAGTEQNGGHVYVLFQWQLRSLCEAPQAPKAWIAKSGLYHSGSGLAALTAACYLVRDGQMKGERVHVFEKDPLPGGACDGYKYDVGYVMRGGREMDNHFEVMWDLLRSIPSLETEGASVLDEYYWLNKADPTIPSAALP